MQKALTSFGASAAAALGYAAISQRVAARKTSREDAKVRRRIVRHSSARAKALARATGHIGKWYTHVPLALVAGGMLALRGKLTGAAAIVGTSIVAAATSPILDRVMKFRAPPPGKEERTQSYPSGHALETTAVSLVAAWVFSREGVARAWVAAPMAVAASVISGGGRLVLDRHWATDSAAGYCAGLALGCAGAGVFELVAPKR